MSLEKTKQWFEQAIPEPTVEQACIQVGCHMEEFSEMLSALADDFECCAVGSIAHEYKTCNLKNLAMISSASSDVKIEILDSIVDQIVTAVGVGHMMGMDVLGALEEINRSNFSKFEDGKPVFDLNGKITKGKDYVKPNLEKFV
jgi:predicted HAD superfamily Cof-like phosphohydrolase